MKNWLDDLVDSSPAARHVAWAGEVSFLSAREDDRTGRVVQLALHRRPEELRTAHPFSAHTRRRRGHTGTVFEASFSPIEAGPEFIGGMMLLNWGSGPKGDTATFLINFESERHPFLTCQRSAKDQPATRWMAVFVETDEQSAPVDQKQRERVEDIQRSVDVEHAAELLGVPPPKRKPKQQIKNSNLAAQFIKNERFWRFAREAHGDLSVDNTADADTFLKHYCEVSSKAELDRVPYAMQEFDRLREEFVAWQQERGYDLTD